VAPITYDYTYFHERGRKKSERLFAQSTAAIELVSVSAIAIPPSRGPAVTIDRSFVLRGRRSPTSLATVVGESWDHLASLNQPAAIQRARATLNRYAVPSQALTLKVTVGTVFAMPYFAGLIENPGGNRVDVVEGVAGSRHDQLATTFTHLGPDLLQELHSGRAVWG
jgi:hypothetical protein